MVPIGFPKTSVPIYQSTLLNIPEDRISLLHYGGALKSHFVKMVDSVPKDGLPSRIYNSCDTNGCSAVQVTPTSCVTRRFTIVFTWYANAPASTSVHFKNRFFNYLCIYYQFVNSFCASQMVFSADFSTKTLRNAIKSLITDTRPINFILRIFSTLKHDENKSWSFSLCSFLQSLALSLS
jgi:hypothetical protein